MIVWLTLLIVAALIVSPEFYRWKTGVPTVASFPAARQKIIEVLQRGLAQKPDGTIIDLGSGNGQLATKIARAMPQAKVVGIELSLMPWLISFMQQKLFGPANLQFRRVNFWTYDCTLADAVVTFLTENIIDRVSDKLRKELKPGAIVVANETPLSGDWKSTEQPETVEQGLFKMKIFLYRQP